MAGVVLRFRPETIPPVGSKQNAWAAESGPAARWGGQRVTEEYRRASPHRRLAAHGLPPESSGSVNENSDHRRGVCPKWRRKARIDRSDVGPKKAELISKGSSQLRVAVRVYRENGVTWALTSGRVVPSGRQGKSCLQDREAGGRTDVGRPTPGVDQHMQTCFPHCGTTAALVLCCPTAWAARGGSRRSASRPHWAVETVVKETLARRESPRTNPFR